MKKITYLITLFVVLITLSCDKEPSRAGLPEVDFKVDFDEQTFVADRLDATVVAGAIDITGYRGANDEAIKLTLMTGAEGVYQLGVQSGVVIHGASYVEASNASNGAWVALTDGVSSQGTVIITDIDRTNKVISGNFTFTGNNPLEGTSDNFVREFTNGIFSNVPYQGTISNPPPPDVNNTFTAKVDGVEFEETLLSGTLINGNIGIVATRDSVDSIGLTFQSDIGPGNYDFAFGSAPFGQYNIFTPTTSNIADGSFAITSHDIPNKRIIGTFSFVAEAFGGGATDSYDITEGSFDITYN